MVVRHLHLIMLRGFLLVIQQVENGKIILHFLQKMFFHAHSARTSSTYPHTFIHKQYQQEAKNALSKQPFIITNTLQISNYLPKRSDNNHAGCDLGWGRGMNRRGRYSIMPLAGHGRKCWKEEFAQMWFSLTFEQRVWVVSSSANAVTLRWHTLFINFGLSEVVSNK